MMKQMEYILKEKELTEERIINGMALLKSNVHQYNSMLEYTQFVKKLYFDLYFKVKAASRNKRALPVDNDELRMFRTVDEQEKKSLAEEVRSIGEVELFTETIHNFPKKRSEKESTLLKVPKRDGTLSPSRSPGASQTPQASKRTGGKALETSKGDRSGRQEEEEDQGVD
jgi:hypothetical protein